MRQHQLGRHEVIALETGMQTEHEARNFAREVYAGLGVTGKTPTQDDLAAIETWHEQGANDELFCWPSRRRTANPAAATWMTWTTICRIGVGAA